MTLEGEVVGLACAYALLGVLLLVAATRAPLPWPVKAAAIAVTSAFYVVAYFRTAGLLGWPTSDPLPRHFQLLWARTVEPDHGAGLPGAINLWLEALDDADLPSGTPRAYRLPYTRALARKVEAARTEIMKGVPQGGRAVDFGAGDGGAMVGPQPSARAGVEPGGDPPSGGFLDPSLIGGESQSIEFAPLPGPRLPRKDEP